MLYLFLSVAWAGPLQGEPFPAFEATPLSSDVVTKVPDPSGDYVVVELIRSADW